MSTDSPTAQPSFSDDSGAAFFIRWRGRQEGPYSAAVIEAKLAQNQIGLLHEISHEGRWVTLREYLADREAAVRAEQQARQEQERRAREEADREAKHREQLRQAELFAEERRRNDALQASLAGRQGNEPPRPTQAGIRKPHRAGTILVLGIVGLIVCGPLCVAAWVMGDNDLREMGAGIMDDTGRSITSTGRTLGILGTILWMIGVIVLTLF